MSAFNIWIWYVAFSPSPAASNDSEAHPCMSRTSLWKQPFGCGPGQGPEPFCRGCCFQTFGLTGGCRRAAAWFSCSYCNPKLGRVGRDLEESLHNIFPTNCYVSVPGLRTACGGQRSSGFPSQCLCGLRLYLIAEDNGRGSAWFVCCWNFSVFKFQNHQHVFLKILLLNYYQPCCCFHSCCWFVRLVMIEVLKGLIYSIDKQEMKNNNFSPA